RSTKSTSAASRRHPVSRPSPIRPRQGGHLQPTPALPSAERTSRDQVRKSTLAGAIGWASSSRVKASPFLCDALPGFGGYGAVVADGYRQNEGLQTPGDAPFTNQVQGIGGITGKVVALSIIAGAFYGVIKLVDLVTD